ncbi:MAG: LemA family protein [Fibrobacterota bacterium]
MKKALIVLGIVAGVFILAAVLIFFNGMGKINNFNRLKLEAEEAWSQVENVYQRRADLVPNLVETVKGYASHEKETFSAIAEARSKMGGQISLSKDALNDPQALEKFGRAQATLGSALQRLMMVQERYPQLKADKNFMALQDELAGTENRIATERRRYNEAVKNYNYKIIEMPWAFLARLYGFEKMAFFRASEGSDKVPEVNFSGNE